MNNFFDVVLNKNNIEIAIITVIVLFYESKFDKPITQIFGKMHFFDGTLKQRMFHWTWLVILLITLLTK